MRERVPPCDVIDEECPCCAAVVRASDAFEGFLARRVPDLQLYVLFVYLNCAGPELNANSQVVLLAEPFVGELEKKA